jgi:hypothetical protein
MALSNLNFVFKSDTVNFNRGLKDSRAKLGAFESSIKQLGGAVAGAFAVGSIANFGKVCVEEFDKAAKSSAKLLNAVDGNAESFRRLSQQAGLLQSNSLFDDEDIQDAQTFLASMNMTEAQVSKLIPVVMDFATKFGMDLPAAANLFAKTIGSATNGLKRYGITVEGTAGSNARFESTVISAKRQVDGFAKAATDAGTSGIVQLQQAIDNLKESFGRLVGLPINRFAKNLKEIIELQTGKTEQNYAATLELEARNLASSAENTEDARKALRIYIQEREKARTSLQQGLTDAKGMTNWGIGKHFAREQAIENATALINGNETAIQHLLETMRDEDKMNQLIAKSQGIANDADEKSVKLTRQKLQEMTEMQGLLEKRAAAFERDSPSFKQFVAVMQRNLKPVPDFEDRTLAPNANQGSADIPVILDADKLKEVVPVLKEITSWQKTLTEGMIDLGSALSQGADSWSDFGKMAKNALRQVVAGLIAKGVASAIEKSLSELPVGVGVAVGALTGGLAAGLFNTLVPKFANGGLAYSPQMAIVGDNRNARLDPEVIAPLSKLEGMLGAVSVRGETVIRGRDIYTIWHKENDFLNRT